MRMSSTALYATLCRSRMSYKRPRSDASPDSGPWGREPVVQLSVSAALDAAQARADAERARHVDELARLQHLVEVERTRHSIETAKVCVGGALLLALVLDCHW